MCVSVFVCGGEQTHTYVTCLLQSVSSHNKQVHVFVVCVFKCIAGEGYLYHGVFTCTSELSVYVVCRICKCQWKWHANRVPEEVLCDNKGHTEQWPN